MPEQYEYRDEDGNIVDPAALGEGYEVVEEEVVEQAAPTPAPQGPAVGVEAPVATPKLSKGVIAIGAAVVLGLGGVAAFGLNQIGNQNTVDSVKAAGQSKISQASEKVQASKEAVTETTFSVCTRSGLGKAMAVTGADAPEQRLSVISTAPLPSSFLKARVNGDGVTGTASLLQLTKTGWAAYVSMPYTQSEKKAKVDRPDFWKADVLTSADAVKVTGDRVWPGGDVAGAGSCEPGEPGVYAVAGKVPADAAGLVDGQASVDAIQGIAGSETQAVAMMGDSVALVELVEGGEAASKAPSK